MNLAMPAFKASKERDSETSAEAFESAELRRDSAKIFKVPANGFVFISAVDTDRALDSFVRNISERSGRDPAVVAQILEPLYNEFTTRLFGLLQSKYNQMGGRPVSVVVLPEAELVAGLQQNIGDSFTVSLNAGEFERDFCLKLSRVFSLNGDQQLYAAPRPGADSIVEQLTALKAKLAASGKSSVCLVDDHAFSCGTVEQVVRLLRNAGIDVDRVATISQVGKSSVLEQMGVPIVPACRFVHENQSETRPVSDCAELVEARYFLMGGSGCVVRMLSGVLARAPYILPYGSPAGRASIESDQASDFSQDVLLLNYRFFQAAMTALGEPIMLRDAHPDVAKLLSSYGFAADSDMRDVISASITRLPSLSAEIKEKAARQSGILSLRIPERVALLDWNGTVVPKGEKGVPALLRPELEKAIARLQRAGISVGFCSDSPVEPLLAIAQELEMSGPVIGENGSVVATSRGKVILEVMPSRDAVKGLIRSIAADYGYREAQEMLAFEFGSSGGPGEGEFAFGRGREASVSCFAESSFIRILQRELPARVSATGIQEALSFDFSPEFRPNGVAIIHPGCDVSMGKSNGLTTLMSNGVVRAWMIGDSVSDIIRGGSAVESFLVDHRPDSACPEGVAGTTSSAGVLGVIEILDRIRKAAERFNEAEG